MTNFEYYKEHIQKFGLNFGIARSGKILKCYSFPCIDCAFYCNECSEYKFKWLYEEHVQPKLTEKEKNLLFLLDYSGYIARDENGRLMIFSGKPTRDDGWWYSPYEQIWLNGTILSFIKWKDEPWAVKDLLKLEVME